MVYLGKVRDGLVVFDGEAKPAEGSAVRVELIEATTLRETIGQKLLKLAGTAEGPEDGSVNVDHYVYGLPKK
jgi:hypothetical protein